ncbi:hypothetical protein BDR03DRAFT_1008494 [Suillus americanus]|nr:hypothetical protein BDR03DRAFT_1008494 [Suillus americanus]
MSVFTPFLVLLSSPSPPSIVSTTILVLVLLSSPSPPSVASTTILILVLLSSPLVSMIILPIHLDSIRHLAMGVNELWDMLEPAATTVPIVSLALSECYIGPAPHSPFVVGINARLVLHVVKTGAQGGRDLKGLASARALCPLPEYVPLISE